MEIEENIIRVSREEVEGRCLGSVRTGRDPRHAAFGHEEAVL